MQQKKQSVYSKIALDLLDKIINDKYPIGSMLPPERELMEIYDVERTTVRRGLELLSKKGHIKKVAGLGSVVMSKTETEENSSVGANDVKVIYTKEQSSEKDVHILCLLPKEPFADSNLTVTVTDTLKAICKKQQAKFTEISGGDETEISEFLANSSPDACVIFTGTSEGILKKLSNAHIPVVFALCKVKGYRCILPDIYESCELVAERLSDLGHTSIAFIGSEENSYLQREYRIKFIDEVTKRNPETSIKQFTNTGGYDEKSGFERLSELIRRAGGNFSAVVTINDEVAKGALKAAKYYRLSVPEDLSVISISDVYENGSADGIFTNPKEIALEIFNSCTCNNPAVSNVYCTVSTSFGQTSTNAKAESNSGRRLSDFLL